MRFGRDSGHSASLKAMASRIPERSAKIMEGVTTMVPSLLSCLVEVYDLYSNSSTDANLAGSASLSSS